LGMSHDHSGLQVRLALVSSNIGRLDPSQNKHRLGGGTQQ